MPDILRPNQRFTTLDALRGFAALAVVQFHFFDLMGVDLFPNGALAVDFFFVLSGFVLTFAYQKRLDDGLSLVDFMKLRIARLYPLYIVGILIGFGLLLKMRMPVPVSTKLVVLVLGITMLPFFGRLPAMSNITPLNLPAWSLIFELIANLLHASIFRGFLRRRQMRPLYVLLGLSAAGEIVWEWIPRNLQESAPYSFGGGLVRVSYSYLAGILLFFLWKSGRVRFRIPSSFSAVILLAMLAVPKTETSLSHGYILLAKLVFFPVLILGSASAQPASWAVRGAELLGVASYAVYVLHWPFGDSFVYGWQYFAHENIRAMKMHAPWIGIIYMVSIVVFALLMDKFYDFRARALLKDWLVRKESRHPKAS